MSGLVFSLSELGSPNGNRLTSDGTEEGEEGRVEKDVSPFKKDTYGTNRHPLTPPDIPTRKPAKKRAKVEAGGIEPNQRPAKHAVTPHSSRIAILSGTRADMKGHEWTPVDI